MGACCAGSKRSSAADLAKNRQLVAPTSFASAPKAGDGELTREHSAGSVVSVHSAPKSQPAKSVSAPSSGGNVKFAKPTTSGQERTSSRARHRARCAERFFEGQERRLPVKLIIFDLDETLTLATFMPKDWSDMPKEKLEVLKQYNFNSPWCSEGKRLELIVQMIKELTQDDESRRIATVLTRNEAGVRSVVNLLKLAGIAELLHAVWVMPWDHSKENGAFRVGDEWEYFNPPLQTVADQKPDVIRHIATYPDQWFPQLKLDAWKSELKEVSQRMQLEELVLVDDQRANFQNPETGENVLRYCKVARYEANYRGFGRIKNMGGIGAHNEDDYLILKRFIREPWLCKETLKVFCHEVEFERAEEMNPIRLMVFDFDETLTLATFMPQEERCYKEVGWVPAPDNVRDEEELGLEDLLKYNFETPFELAGGNTVVTHRKLSDAGAPVDPAAPLGQASRRAKLRGLFEALSEGKAGVSEPRTLAILTKNEQGVYGVLNMLKLAKCDMYFSAIWTMPHREDRPCGVYHSKEGWTPFSPPMKQVHNHKVDIIHHITNHPKEWFPQMVSDSPSASTEGWTSTEKILHGLLHMRGKIESVVLVDDERANFVSDNPQAECQELLRYCKVARYDEDYRDCGMQQGMGGIGAHTDEDYRLLKQFVIAPWELSKRYNAFVLNTPGIGPGGDSHASEILDLFRVKSSDDDVFTHYRLQRHALAARGMPKPTKHNALERLRAGTGTGNEAFNETPMPAQSQCAIIEERLERREEEQRNLQNEKGRTLTI